MEDTSFWWSNLLEMFPAFVGSVNGHMERCVACSWSGMSLHHDAKKRGRDATSTADVVRCATIQRYSQQLQTLTAPSRFTLTQIGVV